MLQMASKSRIVDSLAVLCQNVSDEVVQGFVDHCLTDLFHHQSADVDINDDKSRLRFVLSSGLRQLAELPRDSLSAPVHSLLTGSVQTILYQLLSAPNQVCPTASSLLNKFRKYSPIFAAWCYG